MFISLKFVLCLYYVNSMFSCLEKKGRKTKNCKLIINYPDCVLVKKGYFFINIDNRKKGHLYYRKKERDLYICEDQKFVQNHKMGFFITN